MCRFCGTIRQFLVVRRRFWQSCSFWTRVFVVAGLGFFLGCISPIFAWDSPPATSAGYLEYPDFVQPSDFVGAHVSDLKVLFAAAAPFVVWFVLFVVSVFFACFVVAKIRGLWRVKS